MCREGEAEAVEGLTEAEGGGELVGRSSLTRGQRWERHVGGGSGLGYTAVPEGQMKIMEYKRQALAFTLCLRQYYLDQVLGYNLSTAVDDGGLRPAPL